MRFKLYKKNVILDLLDIIPSFKKMLKNNFETIGTAHLYALYPYKKQTQNLNVVNLKSKFLDKKDHQWAIDYLGYKMIIDDYIEELAHYVRDGNEYQFLARELGSLKVVKIKKNDAERNIYRKVLLYSKAKGITYEEALTQLEGKDLSMLYNDPRLKGYIFKLSWTYTRGIIPFIYFFKVEFFENKSCSKFKFAFFLNYYLQDNNIDKLVEVSNKR